MRSRVHGGSRVRITSTSATPGVASTTRLIQSDMVTREDALTAADSQNNLLWFINNAGKPKAQPSRESRMESSPDASFSEFTLNI